MPQFARPASRKAATISQSLPSSCWRIPSSSAYLARNGGASAVAVAARSEKIEKIVRVRYGAVRRPSVASRRRVRRHDQSSISAPRCMVRWLPGCQTLIASLPCAHASAPRLPRFRRSFSRDLGLLLDLRTLGRARLDRVRELPLEQSVLVDVAVDGRGLEQL